MKRYIRSTHQADIFYLQEPRLIADFNPEYMMGLQEISEKTYMIMYAHTYFNVESEPTDEVIRVLSEVMHDYPELAPEIIARYPHTEFVKPVIEVNS